MDTDIVNREIKVVELDSHNYTNRNGYDVNFLEKKVPLPSIPDNLIDDVVKLKNSNNDELKYTTFLQSCLNPEDWRFIQL
jgi:hypothetical protein